MAKFQCLRSGNFIELFEPDDIKNMASNESYKEVIEDEKVESNEQETSIEGCIGGSNESKDGKDGKEDGRQRKEEGNVLKKKPGRPAKKK